MIIFEAKIIQEGRLEEKVVYEMPDHYAGLLKGLMSYIEEFKV